MKTIKNAFATAAFVALCLSVPSAFGQHPVDQGKSAMATVCHELNLTPSQGKQLTALHQSVTAKVQAIMSDKSMDDDGRHAAITKLHRDLMASASKFLSPTQSAKLEKMIQERMQKHG
jgi:Spy/CpxP family protein refolding chaperone